MSKSRNQAVQTVLMSLEADAVSARSGFACMFSTAAEYESALITQRRAEGRYDHGRPLYRWPLLVFVGGVLMMAAAVLLLSR